MFRRSERYGSLRFFGVAAVAVLAVLFLTLPAYSHSPASVTLKYDLGKQILSVTVAHSPFGESHYVKEIDVSKNSQSVGKYLYSSQPGESFTQTYPIAAKPGDTIEVKATCNRVGSRTAKIVIEGSN